MGSSLSVPITSKALTRTGSSKLKVAACEMQGYRGTMEDYIKIILDFTPPATPSNPHSPHSPTTPAPTTPVPSSSLSTSFFGVFDGHCSDDASAWFSENLPKEILKQPVYDTTHIVNACLEADQGYRAYGATHKATAQPGGTTAVFVILEEMKSPENPAKPFKMTVGNIGDSRCILIRDGERLEQLTKDHSPDDEDEARRVIAAGGCIEGGRIDGMLAVSRALGDHFFKTKHHLPAEQQKVCAVPDVFVVNGVGGDDIILLICDGVYESSSNQHAVAILKGCLSQSPHDPALAVSKLFTAQAKRSTDNMSAIFVQFRDGSAYSKVSSQGEVEYHGMDLHKSEDYNITDEEYEKLQEGFRKFGARYGYPSGHFTPKDSQGSNLSGSAES